MTKESSAKEQKYRGRRKIALVACGALAAAVVCGGRVTKTHQRLTEDVVVPQLSEVVAEAIAARDEAEELAVSGDINKAVALLERISKGWSKIEPAAKRRRYAAAVVVASSSSFPSSADHHSQQQQQTAAQLLDDANQAVAQVRATLGSLFVERALLETRRRSRRAFALKAVRVLSPTCPTLWYWSRKTSPGDEHVRGEVGWVRCYGDLIRSRRIRGEYDLAGVLERDVVTHSTSWFRLRRDTKHLRKAKNDRVRLRRLRDLAKRWPLEPARLRSARSATKPRESSARAERDEMRVRTLMVLSRMSALSPSERAVTARDFGRAKTKARAARRELDEAARKFCAAHADDVLTRARHLAALKDAANAATADLLGVAESDETSDSGGATRKTSSSPTTPDESTSRRRRQQRLGETEATTASFAETLGDEDDDDDEMARWNAGVALAAMLRASQAEPANETEWTSTETTKGALENALDALVARNDDDLDASVSASAAKPPPFGRAFAQHVAAEAAEYVSVAVGVHQHGWRWLHAELARIDTSMRRWQLSIAPGAGPPPGFLGRAEVLQNFIFMRERGGAQPPPQQQQPPSSGVAQPSKPSTPFSSKATRGGTTKAKHHQQPRLEDELTTARSVSLVALGVFALSAAHGTALLRQQQRKDNDGYARRRPKRTIFESVWGIGAHLCLAVCVCAIACFDRVKKAMPPVKEDAKQLLGSLRALTTARSSVVSTTRSPRGGAAAVAKTSSRSTTTTVPNEVVAASAAKRAEDAPSRGRRLDAGGSTPAARVSPTNSSEQQQNERRDEPTAENYAIVSNEDEDSGSDASFSSSQQQTTGDEWKPVPKGGRVHHQGPRILATATKKAATDIGVRDHSAVALNVGVSAIPVVATGANTKTTAANVARPFPETEKKRVTIKQRAPKEESPSSAAASPASSKSRKGPGQPARGGSGGGGGATNAAISSEWKRKHRSQTTWVPYHQQPTPATLRGASAGDCYGADPRAASPVSVVPNTDKQDAIRYQVEYYFSVSNLCKDMYLRTRCMDDQGFVSLRHICSFKRVYALTDDPNMVRDALKSSSKLEVVDAAAPDLCKVRTKDHPERWTVLRPSDESTTEDD